MRRMFYGRMRYGTRKTIINKSKNCYWTLDPDTFKAEFKPMIIQFGGRQTNYKAGHDSWELKHLTHENLTYIFNEGRSLMVTDKAGFEYEPSDGTLTYNLNSCKLILTYTCVCLNEGINGHVKRKHKRK